MNNATNSLTNTTPARTTYNATRTGTNTNTNTENSTWTWFFVMFAAAAVVGLIIFYSTMDTSSRKDRY
jgi:choline-glycine betaine transporter